MHDFGPTDLAPQEVFRQGPLERVSVWPAYEG